MLRVLGYGKNYRQQKSLFFRLQNPETSSLLRYNSHYKSLELKSNASPQDIKSAYYKLSLKYHPDKNQGSAASVEKFREITAAYEVLSNPHKKKVYDESLNYRYSESEWRREHYSPRSYHYNERSKPPRTGRSKYYNYDEHYRQHYEEYEKQRQADFEYFKRRWEADFRRRYPFSEKPNWSENEQRQQVYHEWKMWKNIFAKKYLLYFLSLWGAIFIFTIPMLDEPPTFSDKPKKPPTPIYYKIKRDDDDEKSSEN